MNKRSQTLIISIWVLLILTVLAVSIGHQASMGLSLSRYQKDRLKAIYLAKAGLNRAIIEISADKTLGYDSLNDSWADKEDVFKKIALDNNEDKFATVSYTVKNDSRDETKYGVVDEERKININAVSADILIALLEACQVETPVDVANNILIWRGTVPDSNKIYENLGYLCKANKFTNREEITLVKGISPKDYQKIKELITIYGEGMIDINTISAETLNIFCRGIAKNLRINESFAQGVASKIIELRDKDGYFQEKDDIKIALTGDEETNIFNNLMNNIVFQSNNFLIEVTGNVSKIKDSIVAVYNRTDKKIVYWHEG